MRTNAVPMLRIILKRTSFPVFGTYRNEVQKRISDDGTTCVREAAQNYGRFESAFTGVCLRFRLCTIRIVWFREKTHRQRMVTESVASSGVHEAIKMCMKNR